jgi:mannose-1-phosphate guanylyltransferase/mannose-6-phosphate isomerase
LWVRKRCKLLKVLTIYSTVTPGVAGSSPVRSTDSRNTLVKATRRLVSLIGVKDLIVIETPDAVLVADKTRSQDVKHIVAQLQATQREEHTLNRKVRRP